MKSILLIHLLEKVYHIQILYKLYSKFIKNTLKMKSVFNKYVWSYIIFCFIPRVKYSKN